MSTTHRLGCKCGKCGPPEPPPMCIGDRGDTIDRAGVRRKADGSLRTWHPETLINWLGLLSLLGMVFCIVLAVIHG